MIDFAEQKFLKKQRLEPNLQRRLDDHGRLLTHAIALAYGDPKLCDFLLIVKDNLHDLKMYAIKHDLK